MHYILQSDKRVEVGSFLIAGVFVFDLLTLQNKLAVVFIHIEWLYSCGPVIICGECTMIAVHST